MDEFVRYHEVNETTSDAIVQLYSTLVDFVDDDEFAEWAGDFATELQLGLAIKLGWCSLSEDGERNLRGSYIALLQHVGVSSYFVTTTSGDFFDEINFAVE